MKKRLFAIYMCVFLSIFVMLSACSTEKSLGFEMGNGEIIKVTLDTENGYDLLAEGSSIIVQKDRKDILSGLIITNDGFEANAQFAIENPDEIEIIEAIPEDAPTLLIYQYDVEDGKEIDFLFRIENSEYAGVFVSFTTYDEAKSAFDRMAFRATPRK